jgi:hypothetical protein
MLVTAGLQWRDYFRFFGLKHGNKIFFETGVSGENRQAGAHHGLGWGGLMRIPLFKEALPGTAVLFANTSHVNTYTHTL